MVINGYRQPLAMTTFARTMVANDGSSLKIVIPWRSIVIAFINMQQNTKDACVISKDLAKLGWFLWSSVIKYPLLRNCANGGMNALVYVCKKRLKIRNKSRVVCARECLWSSDLCNVTICSSCRATVIYCDCPKPKLSVATVSVRYPAIKLNVFVSTAMLNDTKESLMTLRLLLK
ncbi:hypothetical protein QIS74_11678 [Colletotrichum tabaci]|uniref:Uncharacterized protein n=1 Tax=Colletotrichum tabaci TaxID=1209068 RepID=A0AAV9SZ33_9PEZI